ncbi:MAG: hypothetical protein RRA94_03155 [Bacteroidota bacterium]|nr:hypothetical protein [Bacteroidota bacterium]
MTRILPVLGLLVLALLPVAAHAQFLSYTPQERVLLGVHGGMAFSWHQGSYTTGDAQFDCCTFSGGNGIGRVVGLRGVLPLSPRMFLRPGISFEELNADYPVEREVYPVLGSDDQVVLMTLEEELSVSLDVFSVEVLFAYRVVDPGMYVMAGPAWTTFMSRHQTQEERILSPAQLVFADGGRTHLLIDSEIEGLSSFFSLRAGAGALFPLSAMFHANPEFLFILPLTDLQSEGEWSVAGFEFSLGVLLVL